MKEIRKIIAAYDNLKQQEVTMALATVVGVEASSYRRIGARMLVAADGRCVGGISGGCLEGDAKRRAQTAIYQQTPSIQVYDTLDGEDRVIGIGLGCNGKVTVLFTPIGVADPENPVEILRSVVDTRGPEVMIQLVRGPKSLQDLVGKPLRGRAEIARRTGVSERQLYREILQVTDRGLSRLGTFNGEAGAPLEMLIEQIRPETRLIAVGDNYDVLALAEVTQALGWELHVVGTRRKFTHDFEAKTHHLYGYDEVGQLQLDAHTALVMMSHDYDKDKAMIAHFLPQQPAYLGMLGPRKRMEKMHRELTEEGFDLGGYPRLFSPVGLDIGAESPEEIAMAICAEITTVFRRRPGGMLKDRRGTIH
ncbi:XdhC family protein [Lewinella sp. W8]|uniref:XdhC family protein n=1 Tax=Lewinella sp. W8 TaxID=2528208 RepID=UPI001565915A|nr:XdhC family protein [Lewinella sp. W8]